MIVLNTTASQERRFKIEAEELGDNRGFSCASSTSSVMSGYGVVKYRIFPGRLADILNEARNKERSESCVDGESDVITSKVSLGGDFSPRCIYFSL